jgi:hypothetical protein
MAGYQRLWVSLLCCSFRVNGYIKHSYYTVRRMSADELEDVVEILFDAMHELYVKAGARNFLIVDVPPLDCSPGGKYSIQCPFYTKCYHRR